MTPREFINKWKPVALNERQTAQLHFKDLCLLVGHPDPIEDDPTGERYSFEKGAPKTGGGEGFADVWKKGYFAWEYKKKKRDLDAALLQLVQYAAALENPPLQVVCDTNRFKIVTAWTNEVSKTYSFDLDDLDAPHNLTVLRAVFHDPESLRSKQSRADLTRKAANEFQTISDRLQARNPDREAVAHFVNQLVFLFFADSVKLLPEGLLKKLLLVAEKRPSQSKAYFDKLFAEMEMGGEFDLTEIAHFNGGLFDGRRALPLQADELSLLIDVTRHKWALVDPTIFGTLFERFLDPDKRAQIGAHYTDADKIMLIVEPVIARPLRAEWEATREKIAALMEPLLAAEPGKKRDGAIAAARVKAVALRDAFIERLTGLRILDPACGSGNFLYMALQAVKDIEYKALLECETLGLPPCLPRVGPEILHGIEINPFAAELARTTIWIGDIQWRLRNAITHHPEPILRKLDSIECRDALLTADGEEAEWPAADFIVGNPPFLGDRRMIASLGEDYVRTLRSVYETQIPGRSDLVCYWIAKGVDQVVAHPKTRVGFVATNSISGGNNLPTMEYLTARTKIFEAWSDEPWVVDGASVRVSIVCFSKTSSKEEIRLDGLFCDHIGSRLTANPSDYEPCSLNENKGVSFIGTQKNGPFDIDGVLARSFLQAPLNVNGRPNSDVVRPWTNGAGIVRQNEDKWIIDFGPTMSEGDAAQYEAPFLHVITHVKPTRVGLRREWHRTKWWLHGDPRPALRKSLDALDRYMATPRVSKHRVFSWLTKCVLPDSAVVAIARDDDTTFGILHSRFHEAWSLRLGTSLEDRPRYTPTTTFETFPFPEGLTPDLPAASYADDPRARKIAAAAKKLDDLRRAWLNPADLVDIAPEITPTAAPGEAPVKYPDRVLPKNAEAAAKLKTRTLTNLYNERPQWLASAHADLDRAVAAAYGWPEDIAIDDALARLLALNLARAVRSTSPEA